MGLFGREQRSRRRRFRQAREGFALLENLRGHHATDGEFTMRFGVDHDDEGVGIFLASDDEEVPFRREAIGGDFFIPDAVANVMPAVARHGLIEDLVLFAGEESVLGNLFGAEIATGEEL